MNYFDSSGDQAASGARHHSSDRWRRHEQSDGLTSMPTEAWGRPRDDRRGHTREENPPRGHALAAHGPHGLRYGSGFPYYAVDQYRELYPDRIAIRTADQVEGCGRRVLDPEQAPRHARSFPMYPSEEAGRIKRERDPWRDETESQRYMPSLGSMLQRPQQFKREPWTGSESSNEYFSSPQRSSGRPPVGGLPSLLGPRDSNNYDRPDSLLGPRRLPSITHHSSPNRVSSSFRSISSHQIARASTRTYSSSDGETRSVAGFNRIHPTVTNLRATDLGSRRDVSSSPVLPSHTSHAKPSVWSSPITRTSSPTDSPGMRSQSLSDDGGGSGGDGVGKSDAAAATTVPKKKKKRKVRICTTPGCDKLVVDHGVCIRHGGGKRCNVEGCECRAQNKGLCWKHGGYTICQVDGCDKRAKSRGMCWSHGGGTQCKTEGCEKIAVSRGRCWAHGGGKRCKLPECQKPAALRLNDYCSEHFAAQRLSLSDRFVGTYHNDSTQPRHETWH